VADAHVKDLQTQAKYGVRYKEYWFDESCGSIFCLVEAPSKEAAEKVHREAHGLTADEIHEVTENSQGHLWKTLVAAQDRTGNA
jgi:hypothetical protein